MTGPSGAVSGEGRLSVGSVMRIAVMVVAGLACCWLVAYVALFLLAVSGVLDSTVLATTVVGAFTIGVWALALRLWATRAGSRRGFAGGLLGAWTMLAASAVWGLLPFLGPETAWSGPTTVTAFDSATVEQLWRIELPDAGGASTPTTWGGMVFVQTGHSYDSAAGAVVALDEETGRELWHVDTMAGGQCGGASEGAPVVQSGVLVVRAPSGDITAFDARNGDELWRAQATGAPAATTAGVVLIAGAHDFTGLDLATGARRWTRVISDARFTDSLPQGRGYVVGGGGVFIIEILHAPGEFGIAALVAGTGRELWRDGVGSVDSAGLRYFVGGDEALVALEGDPEDMAHTTRAPAGHHRLEARVLRTGELLWRGADLPLDPVGLPRTRVATAGNRVFYASVQAGLVALDTPSASQQWTATFPQGSAGADPALWPAELVADERTVVVRHTNTLSGFDAATGDHRWTTRLDRGSDLQAVPALGDQTVFLPTSSNACMPPVVYG